MSTSLSPVPVTEEAATPAGVLPVVPADGDQAQPIFVSRLNLRATDPGTPNIGPGGVPRLSLLPGMGIEDQPLGLSLRLTAPRGQDAARFLLKITDVPAGTVLTQGAMQPDGSWHVPGNFTFPLGILPPPDWSGSLSLTLAIIDTLNGSQIGKDQVLKLQIEPVADQPTITAADPPLSAHQVANGVRIIPLLIDAQSQDRDGSEDLHVVLYNVPAVASLNAGSKIGETTWALPVAKLPGLKLGLPESWTEPVQLILQAAALEKQTVSTATAAINISFGGRNPPGGPEETDPVVVDLSFGEAIEDAPVEIRLNLSGHNGVNSENIAVRLTELPAGARLSAGTEIAPGEWLVPRTAWEGLKVQLLPDFAGPLRVAAIAVTLAGVPLPGAEARSYSTLVTAMPDAPRVSVADVDATMVGELIGEQVHVPLSLEVAAADRDGSETLLALLRNVPAGVTVTNAVPQGGGVWQLPVTTLDDVELIAPSSMRGTLELNLLGLATEDGRSIGSSAGFKVALNGWQSGTGTINNGGGPGMVGVHDTMPDAPTNWAQMPVQKRAPKVDRPDAPGEVVGVTLVNLSGEAGKITTFGHAFRPGDWPSGRDLTAIWNGREVPLQADVKTRYPDGSVRHAVLHVANPDGGSEAQMMLVHTAPRGTAAPVDVGAGLLARGYDLQLTLTFADGKSSTVSAGQLLRQAVQSGRLDQWLSGPLASEARVETKVGPLQVVFDIRALADGSVRTSVGVHNDAMQGPDGNLPYRATISMAGQTVVSHQLDQPSYTNWREVIWAGNYPSKAQAIYDMPYLQATGLLPAYDTTVSYKDQAVYLHASKLTPENTKPLATANIYGSMPDAGFRPDIGPLPNWAAAYIISQDPAARLALLENGEAAGGVPWHVRDPATNMPLKATDHPKVWIDGRATLGENGYVPRKIGKSEFFPDMAHQPSLSFVPYLITGDRYYLNNLQSQAAWNIMAYNPAYRGYEKGVNMGDQVRAQAWVKRELAFVSAISPDSDPMNKYFDQMLQTRLDWYVSEYITNATRGAPKGAETSGWILGYHDPGMVSPFQTQFFSMASTMTSAASNLPKAAQLADYNANWLAGMFTGGGFDPIYGNIYHFFMGDKNDRWFSKWTEVGEMNFREGVFKPGETQLDGYPDMPMARVSLVRATLAMVAGEVTDPRLAAAYGFVYSKSPILNHTMTEHPQFYIVPRFADGTQISAADHKVGSEGNDSMTGTAKNELLYGDKGNDVIDGGAGNDFVIGWDGNDTLASGGGRDTLYGGDGNDALIITGAGVAHVGGGRGADRFVFGRGGASLGTTVVHDFTPTEDVLIFAAQRFGTMQTVTSFARSDGQGNTVFQFTPDEKLVLLGLSPEQLTLNNFAME